VELNVMMSFRTTLAASGLCTVLALTACGGGDLVAYLRGNASGLNSGQSLTLQNNGGDPLVVNSNGGFTFRERLVLGEKYDVTIRSQPQGQVCQVSNGRGSVNSKSDDVTSVLVVCVNLPTLLGTVSGLAAGATVTLSNGGVQLPVNSNGPFAFPGVLAIGTSYQVTVAVNPVGQTCTVTNGVGTTTNSTTPPTPVTVTCR
jgi:hypothetical protein